MGNVFSGGGGSAPAPKAEPAKVETPVKTEVVAARTQAKETMTAPTSRRRRGSLGRISSLLSAGYRGFGQEDKLG